MSRLASGAARVPVSRARPSSWPPSARLGTATRARPSGRSWISSSPASCSPRRLAATRTRPLPRSSRIEPSDSVSARCSIVTGCSSLIGTSPYFALRRCTVTRCVSPWRASWPPVSRLRAWPALPCRASDQASASSAPSALSSVRASVVVPARRSLTVATRRARGLRSASVTVPVTAALAILVSPDASPAASSRSPSRLKNRPSSANRVASLAGVPSRVASALTRPLVVVPLCWISTTVLALPCSGVPSALPSGARRGTAIVSALVAVSPTISPWPRTVRSAASS